MKQPVISGERVLEEVKKAVAETLNIDKDSIKAGDSLMKDLGAESLDFLDINYRLEQTFGIKMARHFVLEHVEDMFGEGAAIDENSQLTEKAVALLGTRMGDAPQSAIRAGMDMDEVPALITVQSMANGVMEILDSHAEKCASCGNAVWSADNEVRIKCSSCGAPATLSSGDDLIREWIVKTQEQKKIF